MWHCDAWQTVIDVSVEPSALFIRVQDYPENGDRFLQNANNHLPDYSVTSQNIVNIQRENLSACPSACFITDWISMKFGITGLYHDLRGKFNFDPYQSNITSPLH
jgi:hypothetical protein